MYEADIRYLRYVKFTSLRKRKKFLKRIRVLASKGQSTDRFYTSDFSRANLTAREILREISEMPVFKHPPISAERFAAERAEWEKVFRQRLMPPYRRRPRGWRIEFPFLKKSPIYTGSLSRLIEQTLYNGDKYSNDSAPTLDFVKRLKSLRSLPSRKPIPPFMGS